MLLFLIQAEDNFAENPPPEKLAREETPSINLEPNNSIASFVTSQQVLAIIKKSVSSLLGRNNDDTQSTASHVHWSDARQEHTSHGNFLGSELDKTRKKRLSITFNKKIKIQGAWNFEMANLGKLHYIVNEDGTREPMTLKYEQAREKRIQRQVFNKWRTYRRRKDVPVESEVIDPTLKKDKQKSSKFECMLPWWCIFLPWLMVVLTTVTCAFFTILYTFNFGVDKSLEWVRSLITSLFSDIFVNQPLTILFVACFFTFIIKRSEMEKLELDVDAEDELDESDEAVKYRLETEKQAISMLKLDDIYRPPPMVLHI